MTFRCGEKLPRWGFEMATNVFDLREFRSDDVAAAGGTAFGSSGAMLQPAARQRERRQAFADLLAGLTRALDRRNDISLMRGAFEDLMRRTVPVRYDPAARSRQPVDRPSRGCVGAESFARRSAWRRSGQCRRARSDIRSLGWRSGEWDFQMLGMAAHVGALVLEIERSSLQLARAGLWAPIGARRDGAAPLIGSTPSHARTARGSIERVVDHRLHGAAGRRKRRRQGAGRTPDPRVEPAPQRPVRRHQLRGACRNAARGRAVRHRRSHGHRRPRAARQVRGGRWRHAVPRRSLRPLVVGAGQTAAGHPGSRGRAGRRPGRASRRHPDRRRNQPQPRGPRRAWAVPAGPLLSPERRRRPCADAARATARRTGARAVFPRAASRHTAAAAVGRGGAGA